MEVHYGGHHKAYVDNLNKAVSYRGVLNRWWILRLQVQTPVPRVFRPWPEIKLV